MIIKATETKVQHLKEEMLAEFNRFEENPTRLSAKVIAVFEKKWKKECKGIDNKILAAKLSPQSQKAVPELESIREEFSGFIDGYVHLLKVLYQTDEPAESLPPESESEQQMKRRQRKERMERYKRGCS